MNNYYKIKEHLKQDSFLRNIFYIDRNISGVSFILLAILRLNLITLFGEIVRSEPIAIMLIIYLSYNTLKWRITTITDSWKLLTIILTIFWTIAILFIYKYYSFMMIYAAPLSISQSRFDSLIIDYGNIAIKYIAAIHIISTLILFLSTIILALVDRKNGEDIFSETGSFYSQKRYFTFSLKVALFNLLFIIVFGILLFIDQSNSGYFSAIETFQFKLIMGIYLLINLIFYFYNTSSRIKDFSISRLWVIPLLIVTSIGLAANPFFGQLFNYLLANISGKPETMIILNLYVTRFIDLVSRPFYHLSILIYFILLFVPGRKVAANG